MRQGEILFNNLSSIKDMHLYMTSYPTIKMASEEYETVTIEGRSGSLIRNKGTYPDIELSFAFTHESEDNALFDLELIQLWLTTYTDNRLYYGRNDKCYRVKKIVFGDFKQEYERCGEIDITFICEPFIYYPIQEEHTITSNYKFYYKGTAPADTFIKVYGSGNIQLQINDQVILLKNVDEVVTIDSDLKQFRDKNNQSKDFDCIGNFIALDKGEYNISYTGNVNKIELSYWIAYRQ